MLQKFVAWCFLFLGAPCFGNEEALAQRFNKLFDFGLDTAQQSAETGSSVFIKSNGDYFTTGSFVATPYFRYFIFSAMIAKDASGIISRDTVG